jgi:hypothetical protein
MIKNEKFKVDMLEGKPLTPLGGEVGLPAGRKSIDIPKILKELGERGALLRSDKENPIPENIE